MKRLLKQYPVFLYLLPVFFVFHGFSENYNFIPVWDAIVLTGMYLVAAQVFALLFWLLYRDFTRANFAAFLIMAFNFFFGSIQDSLREIAPGSVFSRYTFILSFFFILFIVILILVRRRKKTLPVIRYYLNALLLVLMLIDAAFLAVKVFTPSKNRSIVPAGLAKCDSCAKPDIYFILADEYAGETELKDMFQYDNTAFTDSLGNRNFHIIPDSYSNYNYTPFAVASILDMDYLHLSGKERSKPDLTYSYETIRDNRLVQFLQASGYEFYNYSIFDFVGQPARTREGFLAAKTRLITSQTFLNRVDKEIRFNVITRLKSKSTLKTQTYVYKHNNENIYNLTWNLAEKKTNKPRFVYTHLEMPHYPYYFDKNGNERPYDSLQEGKQVDRKAYVEYLQYANKKLLALVDHILQNASTPPVIILMGDHGFRHFIEPVAPKYYFLNLTAIHLPDKQYTPYRDGLHGINLFRTLLNHSFGQKLYYLKDSTSYLND